jgi:hypothetical protein
MVTDELLLTSAEIVIDSYAGSRLGKPINNMAPDKAGATSHECSVYVSQTHIFTEVHRLMKFSTSSELLGKAFFPKWVGISPHQSIHPKSE